MNALRKLHRDRGGKVLVLIAISLVAITGVLGVVVDGGMLLAERRRAQSTADAASLGAAIELAQDVTPSAASDKARSYAAYNGYSNDGVNDTVTVNIPPASGPNANRSGYVEVITSRTLSKYFIGIVYPGARQVKARSVAKRPSNLSSAALLVLQDIGTSFTMSGQGIVNVNGGKVVVNSTGTPAVSGSGSVKLNADYIDIGGTYTLSNTAQMNGTITTGAAAMTDPLNSVPAVDLASLPVINSLDVIITSGSQTLQPGFYGGKISVSNGAAVALQPGIYYVTKDFSVSGSSTLQADGVMVYVVGNFTLSGTGAFNLSPPTSGTYKGISVFTHRTSNNYITLSGGSNMNVTGTLYGPGATTTLSGTSGVGTFGSQTISKKLSLSGSATINVNYDGGPVGDTKPRLVE